MVFIRSVLCFNLICGRLGLVWLTNDWGNVGQNRMCNGLSFCRNITKCGLDLLDVCFCERGSECTQISVYQGALLVGCGY